MILLLLKVTLLMALALAASARCGVECRDASILSVRAGLAALCC